MVTFYGEVSPRQYTVYQSYTNTRFQPSWYKGERYDYVDQMPASDRKSEKHSFLFRNK